MRKRRDDIRQCDRFFHRIGLEVFGEVDRPPNLKSLFSFPSDAFDGIPRRSSRDRCDFNGKSSKRVSAESAGNALSSSTTFERVLELHNKTPSVRRPGFVQPFNFSSEVEEFCVFNRSVSSSRVLYAAIESRLRSLPMIFSPN